MSHGALVGRALALLRQDDPSGALECANEVLESIRSGSPDKAAEISALCACVDAHVALGDATKALAKAEEASSLAKSLTTSFAEAAPSLAMVKVKLMASQESKEALALLREIGASWGETALLLALALRAAKEPAQARSLLERARRLQQRWQETFALLTLAVAALSKGSPAMAEIDKFLAVAKKHGLHIGDVDPASSVRRLQGSSTMEDMQEIHDRLSAAAKAGQRSAQAWATLDLADAKLGQGLMKVQELEDATTQLQKIGSKEGLAMAKFQASRSHLACGRPIEALADALVAAKNFKDLGDAVGEAAACSACALAHLELGQLPEAVSLASKAPQDLAERGLRRACADALRVASQVYLQLGEQERAMQVGLEAAAALRDVGDSRGEAFALLNEVASAYVFRKEVDSALNVASASLRLLRAAEDLPGELAALKATAALHLCRGDTEPALRLLQEVISLSHDSGDVSDEVDAHVSCARLRVLRCEAAEATLSAEAAVKAASTEMTEAKALLGMAKVLGAKEEMSAAREAAQKAAALFKQKGYCSGEFLALDLAWQCSAEAIKLAQQSAQAFHSSGDLCSAAKAQLSASRHALRARSADVATAAAEKALQIFRELKHTKGEAEALQSLSAAEAARGRPSSSIKAAVDMVALYTRRGDLRGQAEATCRLAKVYLDLGMLKDALSEVGEARLLFQKLPPQLEEAQLLLEVAIPTHGAMENPPKAVAMAEDAANICRSLGDRVGEAKAFKACAKVCVQKNDTKSALQASRQAAAVLSRARLAREEAEAYHLTAKIHLLRLEPREAVSSAAQALTLLRRPGDEDEKAAVLVTASYAHGMAMEYDGAVGTASEAVDLCRRTGNKRRLKMAMHALAEGYLIKGDYGQALDLAEEAQHKDAQDKILEARLLEVSCYARLGWSSSKKKGLRANVRDMLQKAQAASAILVAAGNKRQEADAKFLMGKVQLQAGNLHAAIKEVTKAYDAYGALKDGQGVGWTGLLYAACLLRSPAKLVAGRESAVTSKEIEIPQYDGALHSALVAHSTFRRIGDEEGTEAALKVVNEIRSLQEGSDRSLHKDMPRPRPLPPAFSSAPTAVVHPYHELVGGRQLPFQVPDLQVPPPETETEAEKPSATEAVAAAAIRSLGDRVSEAKALGAIQPLQKNDTKSALQSALVAQSTFRRIEDEEGTEAALKVVNEIRSWQEGSD